jgi:hypothetical protein
MTNSEHKHTSSGIVGQYTHLKDSDLAICLQKCATYFEHDLLGESRELANRAPANADLTAISLRQNGLFPEGFAS